MKVYHLDQMTGGWFVGNFTPAALVTKDFEVAVKRYRAGDHEPLHEHRVATEITVIVEGTVRMAGMTLGAGEIAVLAPGEASNFVALADCVTVCVKFPSTPGDKYILGDGGGE